ncbi:MAG: hypothetical protein HY082_03795 [Gammaproteobacteria bacterium]|nr:hypothetical protein [Gammaproteobacteria bacterium]
MNDDYCRKKSIAFWLAIGLGSVALAAIYCYPVFVNISNWGIQDWDAHYFYHVVPRQTIVDYHELPLWNPYACGGMPMLANPQSRILTPFFLLHLVFGVPLAIRLEIVLHLALAFLGAILFASTSGVRRLGAVAAGAVYAFSTYFAVNLMTGMTVFLAAAYLPFIGWLLVRKGDRRENAWGIALCLALVFGEGGHYLVPIFALFILALLIARGNGLSPLAVIRQFATISLVAVGLSAIKLLPAIELMITYPRQINDYSGYNFVSLLYSLLSRHQAVDAVVPSMTYGMDENGIYVGILGIGLAAVGVMAQWRQRWKLLIVFAIFLWLSFGNRVWPSLWSFLHLLPVYDSMRVAQRFRVVWLLGLALFAGIGLDAIRAFMIRVFRRPVYGAAVGLAVLITLFVDLFAVGLGPWRDAFTIPAPAIERASEFRQESAEPFYDAHGHVKLPHSHGAGSAYLPAYYANRGTIDCYESVPVLHWATPFDATGYLGEIYVIDATGNAEIIKRTPNTISIRVQLNSDGAVVINQNFYRGWWANTGEIVEYEGLLAVKLGPGIHEISLRFLPVSFILGALITLGTMGYGIWALIRHRRIMHISKASTAVCAKSD